jgi:hypothetical protein
MIRVSTRGNFETQGSRAVGLLVLEVTGVDDVVKPLAYVYVDD